MDAATGIAGYPSLWAAIESIAPKIGGVPQTLQDWVRQSEVESGAGWGMSTLEAQRMKDLERGVKDWRRANVILKLASALLAQAELDRRLKRCTGSPTSTAARMGASRSARCCRLPHWPIVAMPRGTAIRP
jgi:transposase-like protein